jgi:hypothetical protein
MTTDGTEERRSNGEGISSHMGYTFQGVEEVFFVESWGFKRSAGVASVETVRLIDACLAGIRDVINEGTATHCSVLSLNYLDLANVAENRPLVKQTDQIVIIVTMSVSNRSA